MTETVIQATEEPDGAPRLPVLDVLRGIAILGILFMNIDGMGGPLIAHLEPRALGWALWDRVAWCARAILADGTARGMLEMLFGAGMAILTDRAASVAAGRWEVLRGYYRRNLVLFGFGVVHIAVLGWFGDILHTYGLAAMIAFLFRRWPARWLLVPGLSFAAFVAIGGGVGLYDTARQDALVAQAKAAQAAGRPVTAVQREAIAGRARGKANEAAFAAQIEANEKGRSGGPAAWWRANVGFYGVLLRHFIPYSWIWEAASAMLIGVALFRWGVLQGGRDRAFYLKLMAGAYLVGMSLRAVYADQVIVEGGGRVAGLGLDEVARLATTLGHVAAVNLLLTTGHGRWLLSPFAAAGRVALSIYIAQTIVVMWLLISPLGLHLYGRMSWAPLMLTAVVVDAVLLLAANAWVRHFRIAPVEWAWRSIVAGRRLAFRRVPSAGAETPAVG